MIAGFQKRGQRTVDRRHARGRGKGVLRPLDRGDAFLEHPHGRIAVAGIDELIRPAFDEARLGLFGTFVDEALGQIDRLGHLAILATPRACVDEFRLRLPVAHGRSSGNKKPPPEQVGANASDLFSGMFNVARNPVTNRHVTGDSAK